MPQDLHQAMKMSILYSLVVFPVPAFPFSLLCMAAVPKINFFQLSGSRFLDLSSAP